MSEDLTAAAALSIERYIAGLRAELTLLGSAESDDLVYEIRDMLLDAAKQDPQRAFAEMDRLGKPAELAATLLAERGITSEGGIPSASWWLLGIAATLDILVGVALPIAVLVNVYGQIWQSLFGVQQSFVSPADRLAAIGMGLTLLAFAAWFAWRMWAPWRDGSTRPTVGMALTGIAVVRIGGSRAVARTADLAAAGLHTVNRSKTSAAVWTVLALLALSWSLWMVSAGAFDPSGGDAVYRLAGSPESQQNGVGTATSQLYEAAMSTDPETRSWPPMAEDRFDGAALREQLVQRFGSNTDSGGGGFEMGEATNVSPGVWTMSVWEIGPNDTRRRVVLTYELRVEWLPDAQPQATFVLAGYKVAP